MVNTRGIHDSQNICPNPQCLLCSTVEAIGMVTKMHKQTYLGDNIVKELESEPTSGLVGDSDVKIGDGIGHLDVSVPVEL